MIQEELLMEISSKLDNLTTVTEAVYSSLENNNTMFSSVSSQIMGIEQYLILIGFCVLVGLGYKVLFGGRKV